MSDDPQVKSMPPTIKELGDPRKDATWTLLPVAAGLCSQCGREHDPEYPHDAQALRYQYAFYAEYERWPNWRDAMAHCAPEMQEQWTQELRKYGVEI